MAKNLLHAKRLLLGHCRKMRNPVEGEHRLRDEAEQVQADPGTLVGLIPE